MIDERTRAALGRLTENERACLLRRLHHQTAKEMAIDLGISPHAVEKRLKMARTKLGVSSSLEAARLLEASEGYGHTGPQASDLGVAMQERQHSADPAMPRPAWRRIAPYVLTGAIAMSLAVIALLAVAPLNAPAGGVAPLPEGGTAPLPASAPKEFGTTSIVKTIGEWEAENHVSRPKLVKASPDLVKAYVNSAFDGMDRDHSGFIERKEAPTTGVAFETTFRKGPQQKLSERPLYADKATKVAVIAGTAGQAAWIGIYDQDGDGKVSRQEYVDHSYEINLARGIPEGWQPPGPPPNMVKAPAETIRLFLNESFDTIDKDHSAFIERAEVPASLGNTPAEISKGPGFLVPHPEAQAAWLAMFDKDADGKVSRREYLDESFERFANWGVPANWRGAPKVAAK